MVATPLVGATRFSSMRRVVVLPEPLGPRKPVTRPGSTVNDSPSTARTFGYTLVRPDTTSRPSMELPSSRTATLSRPSNPVGPADHVFEARPGVVDGAHLHVDPAVAERKVADHVLIEIRGYAGGPLGPGDPERPGRGGARMERGPARREPFARR